MLIETTDINGKASYLYISEAEPTNALKSNEQRFFNAIFSELNKAIDFAINSVEFSESSNLWHWNCGDGEEDAEFFIKTNDDDDDLGECIMTTNNNIEIWELQADSKYKQPKYLLALGKCQKVNTPKTYKISVTLEYEFECTAQGLDDTDFILDAQSKVRMDVAKITERNSYYNLEKNKREYSGGIDGFAKLNLVVSNLQA